MNSINAERFIFNSLLKDVSRSFYLTLKVLPASSRTPISVAYLLARAADTVADTVLIEPVKRLGHLNTLTLLLENYDQSLLTALLNDLNKNHRSAEQKLLEKLPDIFAIYHSSSELDKILIKNVVNTLISGMIMDLETFPHEQSGRIASLIDAGDLDKYTYLVAGCVGEFWTLVCAEHEPQCRAWHLEIQQQERGIRLGKALQLTNILRDVAQDLRIGRCYLPLTQLHKLQLNPEDLLDLNSAAQAKPILDDWLVIALNHYEAGSDYAMAIPKRAIRLRLAVFWPMLIGLATLSKLANNPDWLSPAAPIKVSRRWVYKMMLMSLPCIASNRIMAGWLKRLQSEVKAQLHETHRHSLPH